MSSAHTRTESAEPIPFRSVGIVGLGVMGGSFAMALHERAEPCDVVGWSLSDADLDAAEKAGAISRRASSLDDVARDVDLLVLAIPLAATCELVGRLAPSLGEDALLHDVASLKSPVQAAVLDHGLERRWVGGHPMCGSEASGFGSARSDLYENARVWMVADESADANMARVEALWRRLGADPRRTDASAHDELMGLASHLPQLTANLLGQSLAEAGVSLTDLGPGGVGITRLAESNPEIWLDILSHASASLPAALRRLGSEAARIADALDDGDLDALRTLMEQSRGWRRTS